MRSAGPSRAAGRWGLTAERVPTSDPGVADSEVRSAGILRNPCGVRQMFIPAAGEEGSLGWALPSSRGHPQGPRPQTSHLPPEPPGLTQRGEAQGTQARGSGGLECGSGFHYPPAVTSGWGRHCSGPHLPQFIMRITVLRRTVIIRDWKPPRIMYVRVSVYNIRNALCNVNS